MHNIIYLKPTRSLQKNLDDWIWMNTNNKVMN